MSAVLREMEAVAPTNATVLIQGESGVGKEVVARAIHRLSPFANGPFVPVNCGALPDSLIDSALFGHEKGAFTGAQSSSRGFFEQAQGGTLFLDEIGELPLAAQARLLRVLERRELQRVGGERRIGLNIRILAATHRNLRSMTRTGNFREDLWYRLSLFPLKIPPLRQRREDIIVLLRHFCATAPARLGLSGSFTVPPATVNAMLTARWPGNVRQLQHAVERAVIRASMNGKSDILFRPEDENEDIPIGTEHQEEDLSNLDALNKNHILRALHKCKGRISGKYGAALLLGINPNTLRSRMKRMGISAKEY
ncbi:MAG TPA: sigma-54 dependent transcriptional regulator [Candidatus Mailhella merdavium]|nr:sigma-54 dependent transcriptional regulator [Candidatus Mailhella merdavium]